MKSQFLVALYHHIADQRNQITISLQHAATTCSFVAVLRCVGVAHITSHFDADIFIHFVSAVSPSNFAYGLPTSTKPNYIALPLEQLVFCFHKTSTLASKCARSLQKVGYPQPPPFGKRTDPGGKPVGASQHYKRGNYTS